LTKADPRSSSPVAMRMPLTDMPITWSAGRFSPRAPLGIASQTPSRLFIQNKLDDIPDGPDLPDICMEVLPIP
jgi:hypothetical protein